LLGCGKKESDGLSSGPASRDPVKEKETKQALAILKIRTLNGAALQKGDGWIVNVSGTGFRDGNVLLLDDLQPLVALNLSQTGITNDVLHRLGTDFKQLENLNLFGTHVINDGLEWLKDLKQLRSLSLGK